MADSPNGAPQAGLDPELADLQAKAQLAQEQVKAAMATVTSEDGATTLTVGPNGSLVNLQFTERAYHRSPQELAATVMKLAAKGQREVSAKVMEAFSGLVGQNSKAMEMLTEFLPADPNAEDAENVEAESAAKWGALEQPGEPTAPHAARPPMPAPQPPAPWPGSQPPQQPPQARPAPRPQRRAQHDDQDDEFEQPW